MILKFKEKPLCFNAIGFGSIKFVQNNIEQHKCSVNKGFIDSKADIRILFEKSNSYK